MAITPQHRQIASEIDQQVRLLESLGLLEVNIMGEMAPFMGRFKVLMDSLTESEINLLCTQYGGLYRYAKILDTVASGIASGRIKVPK